MFERRSGPIRLLAVADAERIVTAADRLAMTQPAPSRVAARLEREFGGSLFVRIPAGVRPTLRFGTSRPPPPNPSRPNRAPFQPRRDGGQPIAAAAFALFPWHAAAGRRGKLP